MRRNLIEDLIDRELTFKSELLTIVVATAAATILAFLISPLVSHLGVALVYLLVVVLAGLVVSRWSVLYLAAGCAIIWNFFFIPPRFTVYIHEIEDIMFFAMFFIVAVVLGNMTNRLRNSQRAQRQREKRTSALYELARQAGLAHDIDAGLREAVRLVEATFDVGAALLLRSQDHTLSRERHSSSSLLLDESAWGLAQHAFSGAIAVGRFTSTYPDAETMQLPLKGRSAVMGVLVILPNDGRKNNAFDQELIESFAALIGTILERDHLLAALRDAELIEASEQLHRALLQSVSHELKTPLAAIKTGMEALVTTHRETAIPEIQTAIRRLDRVIKNLLDMSRIESGVIKPKMDWCDPAEIVENAAELAADGLANHRLVIDSDQTLPMVRLDQALLEQCLSNLLFNAAAWSPQQSKIAVVVRLQAGELVLTVQDEGTGIPAAELPHLFGTFYRGKAAKPGGAGLGLAIVDGFVRAHDGRVTAANRDPSGAEFQIAIPVETLPASVLENLR